MSEQIVGGAVCSCGARPHATSEGRCSNGHVIAGNTAALKHGVRAFEARGEAALPSTVRESVDDFRSQVVADRGGELTAIEAGYVRRLGELEAVVRLLASDLATRGLFTARGRTRNTLGRWFEALDRWDRYAQRVGAERKARPVDPLEALRRAVDEVNRQ
jgi:hypothetical protein